MRATPATNRPTPGPTTAMPTSGRARAAGSILAAALLLTAAPPTLPGQAADGTSPDPAAAERAPGETGDATPTTSDRATAGDTAVLEGAVRGLLPDSLRTEVLVLGTTHLSQYSDRFRPELLDSLIGALAAWGPDAVGVERDPPEVYGGIDAEEEPGYARSAQEALGVSLERALAGSDSLLGKASAGELSTDERAALVRHLLAATRLPTATLHWTRLPADARSRAALPEEVREAMERRAEGVANEIYSIGVRLARERDLAQVHNIDDHTADRVYDLEGAVARGLREHLAGHPTYDSVRAYMKEGKRRTAGAIEGGDLLPYYRWKNAPETVTRDVRLQWGIFLELADDTPMAQKRLAHWEIRNLKMVTHVRKMTLHHPGGRVLVVVGAGHKAFFDAYLDRMLDVEVVHLGEILDGASPTDRPTNASNTDRRRERTP